MRRALNHVLMAAAAGLSAAIFPATALAQVYPPYGGHMWSDGPWHGWFLGPLMMIIFIAVAVAVVVLLVRWLGGGGHHGGPVHPPSHRTPLDILRERYARGEIDKEEFEERRRILGD